MRQSNIIATPGPIIEELAGNELEDGRSQSASPVRRDILRFTPAPVGRATLRSVPRPAQKAAPKKPGPPELTASEIVDLINYENAMALQNAPSDPPGIAVQYCFCLNPTYTSCVFSTVIHSGVVAVSDDEDCGKARIPQVESDTSDEERFPSSESELLVQEVPRRKIQASCYIYDILFELRF